MIDFDNQTDLVVDIEALESIASNLSTKEIELLIVDTQSIQTLNRVHRAKDSSTDVLSFPLQTPFTEVSDFDMSLGLPLGSIVICDSYVKEKAIEFGHTQQDELSLLFIHGMLHLLGFDHEVDNGDMRKREETLINQFDLPKSLIIRTGE